MKKINSGSFSTLIMAKTLECIFIKYPVCLPAYLSTHTHCVSFFVFMKTEHPEILF